MLEIRENRLIYHYDAEEVWIEPWGPNALRVRATKERQMPEEDWALCRKGEDTAEISYTEQGAHIAFYTTCYFYSFFLCNNLFRYPFPDAAKQHSSILHHFHINQKKKQPPLICPLSSQYY